MFGQSENWLLRRPELILPVSVRGSAEGPPSFEDYMFGPILFIYLFSMMPLVYYFLTFYTESWLHPLDASSRLNDFVRDIKGGMLTKMRF